MKDHAIANRANPILRPITSKTSADRLQHNRELESAADPGILLFRDVQLLQNRWSRHGKRATGQVIDAGSQHDQSNHPPSQSFDPDHDSRNLMTESLISSPCGHAAIHRECCAVDRGRFIKLTYITRKSIPLADRISAAARAMPTIWSFAKTTASHAFLLSTLTE